MDRRFDVSLRDFGSRVVLVGCIMILAGNDLRFDVPLLGKELWC
jgi:hypothetical protein